MPEPVHVEPPAAQDDAALYDRAKGRLDARRGLQAHALAFVLVNAFLVVVWAVSGGGDLWPVLPLAGWGIGLALHAWTVLVPAPTPETIRAEADRARKR